MLIQRHHRGELHVKKEYRFGVLDVEEEHEEVSGASSLMPPYTVDELCEFIYCLGNEQNSRAAQDLFLFIFFFLKHTFIHVQNVSIW